MSLLRGGAAAALIAAGATIPAAAAAQECGVAGGTTASAVAGVMSYQAADLSGPSFGADFSAGVPAGPLPTAEARAGVRMLLLDGGGDPLLGTAVVAVPLPLPVPLNLCGTVHGGAVRVALEDEAAHGLAGGLGLRVAAPLMVVDARTVPYVELRGLAGWSTGSVFGADWSAHGFSMGVSAGVQAVVGRFELRAAATLDGFDEGLGITPYPSATGEVGVGLRF